jgi:phage portal protein BeeE
MHLIKRLKREVVKMEPTTCGFPCEETGKTGNGQVGATTDSKSYQSFPAMWSCVMMSAKSDSAIGITTTYGYLEQGVGIEFPLDQVDTERQSRGHAISTLEPTSARV